MYTFDLIKPESYEEMSRIASDMIIDVINENPTSLFCFAGGDTPVRTLELLVEAHHAKKIDLSKAYYIGLDEWIGLDDKDKGSCIHYMNKNLFIPANIPKEHIHFFNAKSVDLENECVLADKFVKNKQGIKLSLLGVGVNGHLGFNEPGTDFESLSHVVQLDNSTKNIGKKYFEKNVETNKGITLGLQQVFDSDHIILEASGTTKKEALEKLLNNELNTEWPITSLSNHKNCTVLACNVL